jgi:hypothetical protein
MTKAQRWLLIGAFEMRGALLVRRNRSGRLCPWIKVTGSLEQEKVMRKFVEAFGGKVYVNKAKKVCHWELRESKALRVFASTMKRGVTSKLRAILVLISLLDRPIHSISKEDTDMKIQDRVADVSAKMQCGV